MSVFPRLCKFVCFTARHCILEQLLTLGLGGLILHMLAQLLTLGGRILLTRRHETLHCLHENTIAGKKCPQYDELAATFDIISMY